ncbi:hypothetical protein NMY22_g5017 [Coprinellus aureogranulatus]|nr:hypothetical protein NMY22_g5017 [Coprinellus aureogranulatus]
MRVVDVLSSDDDFDAVMDQVIQPEPELEPEPEPEAYPPVEEVRVDLQAKTKGKGKKGAAQAKKSLMFTSAPLDDSVVVKKREREPSSSAMQLTASIPPATWKDPSVEEQVIEDASKTPFDDDVPMGEVLQPSGGGVEARIQDEDTKMEDAVHPALEAPKTPPQDAVKPVDQATHNTDPLADTQPPGSLPRSSDETNSRLPENPTEGDKQPQEPPFFPPLSKLPFVPINELTEAELDMTVEEWIRYQMEVEYDKFRRDGERELQRFRKRAEEARKIIEGL